MKLLEDDSRGTLIIIDDVLDRDVVNGLQIPYKHVKCLVTSQTSDLCQDVTASVQMAKPSMEEAHQILRKHSGRIEDTPLDLEVQAEMNKLVNKVDFNPLVLANLGAVMKSKVVDFCSDFEAENLRRVTQDQVLSDLINQMDEDKLETTITAFGETYKQTIGASMTLGFHDLTFFPRSAKQSFT